MWIYFLAPARVRSLFQPFAEPAQLTQPLQRLLFQFVFLFSPPSSLDTLIKLIRRLRRYEIRYARLSVRGVIAQRLLVLM